jgi:hypothetical protein
MFSLQCKDGVFFFYFSHVELPLPELPLPELQATHKHISVVAKGTC